MQPWVLVYAALYLIVFSTCSVSKQGSSASQRTTPLSEPTISTNRKVEDDASLIKPGRGVGLLQLGQTREQVVKLLGEKREEYAYDYPCKYSEMHWYDAERDSNGLFVFLSDGLVYQIEAATSRYRTDDSITEESSPEDVRHSYQQLKSYA